jgi:cell division protein FtsW (lipid II flippase)
MSGNADIRAKPQIPFSLVGLVLAIGALGVSNIYSAARTTYPDLWIAQCVWLGIGVVVSLVGLFLDYHSIEQIAYPFYGLIVFLLLLVPIMGRKVLGAKRWLNFGFGNFQPSELMKIAIIFILARFFAEERRDAGYTIRDLIRPLNISRPVAAIAALIYQWKKNPWLGDPVGELARKIAIAMNGRTPQWEESYFFRMFALTAITLYFSIGAYAHTQASREQNPFDDRVQVRRRASLVLWLGPPILALILCFVFWQSEFMGDPSAVVVGWLVKQGGPDGAFAEFHMRYWFRAVLVVGLLAYLGSAIYRQLTKGGIELADLLAPIDLVVIPMGLIGIEPDLGTALLVGSVAFSVILFVGMRYASVIIMAASGVVLTYFGWFFVFKDYQKQRVLTFLDPEADALGTGYHAIQSMIAVGSGRFLGKGFAAGTQSQLRFLPEQHTDFAFSVWSEEHGFAGCIVLIALYFILVVVTVNVAAKARDKFGALLVTGFCSLIFWQAFVNMGMVIGLLPIVGVPLPLFSYGGSSLLTVMIGLAVTLNVAYRAR